MATPVLPSDNLLNGAYEARGVGFVRTSIGLLRLWRRGLGFLKDWKIYADFLSGDYQRHNIARLQHLASLGLPISGKRILELGAGIGDHTIFYLHRNCRVLAIEGRARSASVLKKRLGIDVRVLDLDGQFDAISSLGEFDFVHCYGLLYHLKNPEALIQRVAKNPATLLLETCVSHDYESVLNSTGEPTAIPSQAIHGVGCRPSRSWVFETLRQYYKFVYATKTQPNHREFPLDWSVVPPGQSQLARAVFVASHSSIENEWLTPFLPVKQQLLSDELIANRAT
jgi:SAM-dependent methyltransferase